MVSILNTTKLRVTIIVVKAPHGNVKVFVLLLLWFADRFRKV